MILDPPEARGKYRRCLVHMVRASQFLFVPFLALCSLLSGTALLIAGQHVALLFFAAAAFILPALPILLPFFKDHGALRTVTAALRWALLMLYVLSVLHLSKTPQPTAEIAIPDDAA